MGVRLLGRAMLGGLVVMAINYDFVRTVQSYDLTVLNIYMYIHICTYVYIYTCPHVYRHTHVYAHTYKMYICTHASTSETTARHRLHGKPDLTPRSSALLPVCCNSEGDYPSWPAAQLPVHEERRISAEQQQTKQQLITPSRQRAVQTTSAYLH